MIKEKGIINLTFNEKLGDFLVPFWLRRALRSRLETLGIHKVPYRLLSYLFYFTVVIDVVLSILIMVNFFESMPDVIRVVLFLFIVVFLEVGLYLIGYFIFQAYLVSMSYRRAKEIDKALPDFLTEVNLQLRSGMPLYNALEKSLNTEYGFLNDILKDIVKSIKLGKATKEALITESRKYNSIYLLEAMTLVGKADEEGANSIALIDRLIENINMHHYMQEQIISNVSGYIFFISMMALVIAPALFSSSYHILVLIKGMINKIFSTGASNALNFSLQITVNEHNFFIFTLIATLITAFCSAYLIGIIKEGQVKKSLKTIVIYVVIAFGMFWAFHYIFGIMFSKFLTV